MFGGGFKYSKYETESFRRVFINNNIISDDYSTLIDLFAYQAYGQASDRFLNDKLLMSLGLRFDGNTFSKNMVNPLNQFSPRLSASYKLMDNYYINSSIGRYNQQTRPIFHFKEEPIKLHILYVSQHWYSLNI